MKNSTRKSLLTNTRMVGFSSLYYWISFIINWESRIGSAVKIHIGKYNKFMIICYRNNWWERHIDRCSEGDWKVWEILSLYVILSFPNVHINKMNIEIEFIVPFQVSNIIIGECYRIFTILLHHNHIIIIVVAITILVLCNHCLEISLVWWECVQVSA